MTKTEIDIETLLHWAYRDELSKRQLSSAEGIWDRIAEDGWMGPIDRGHGSAQRYSHFGLPDPDAERIGQAVTALEDLIIDWQQSFDAIAAELSGLIKVNDLTKRETPVRAPKAGWGKAGAKALKAWWGKDTEPAYDRPRDVLMVNSLKVSVLVTVHAIKGTRPDWIEEGPKPLRTPAERGTHAKIFGDCKGKNLYSLGAHCPLKWSPSPMSIVSSRADYVAWHRGLTILAQTVELAKFIVLPPKAPALPWLEDAETMAGPIPVMPAPGNHVSAWGTLPLAPDRGRTGPPPQRVRSGQVRYPLEGEVA